MNIRLWLSTVVALGIANTAFALNFTEDDIIHHRTQVSRIVTVASQCLDRTWNTHVDFYDQYQVSKYYGDRNKNLETTAQRLLALKEARAPLRLIEELEPISCIGLTLKCLKEGFDSTRDERSAEAWKKIYKYVIEQHDKSGMHLQMALRALGWKLLYWNPDPTKNAEWDEEDHKLLPGKKVNFNSGVKNENGDYIYHVGWGMHAVRYQSVMKWGKYYKDVNIDDAETLVGYGKDVPEKFKTAPFFVGVAHAGYHVFPGHYGMVIEGHSSRPLTSFYNLEESFFNPLESGGGPKWTRSEKYRSGVIALPPLY